MKEAMKRLALAALTAITALGITSVNALPVHAEPVTGKEWTTPEAVRVNQTEARSAIIPFDDMESAKQNPTLRLGKNSPNYIDLDGTWKFYWVSKPADKPDITGVTSIPENYFDITVPSSWQTNMQYAGWKGDEIDWPIYNNQDYPWETSGSEAGKQARGNGSAAPAAYNPVGTYMRTVTIDEKDIGNRFIITFNGVEAGFYLYVNGQAVGYDEDSFTTAEFDITDYLHAGENLIAAQVYHYTTGSYIENQDMIYYAGIHRDVYITKQPKVAIFDYNVETKFDSHNYDTANLELTVDVANITDQEAVRKVRVALYDGNGVVVPSVNGLEQQITPAAGKEASATFKAAVANPKMWSAEIPNLYTLVMALCDSDGSVIQAVGKRVGFREFYVEGSGTKSEMRINGQNIEFYGVNRGEADPAGGHHIPYETIVKDVVNAKQLNINAIRTSHFPPDPNLIELADEYGLYIMDEVNVESHNARTMGIPAEAQYESGSGRVFPGNDRRYQNAMVDRMTSMVMRDKNNASVIIYSLGNEAGTDVSDKLAPDPQEGNFNRMIDVIKALDSEKLIHYQGWVGNRRVDINGAMYPTYNPSITDKPYIMMEYQHSMGNTGGDFEKYTDGFESSARYQGGFIWDYVDQSAYTPKDGEGGPGLEKDDLFFGFDHSWKQNSDDYNFCVNGFIFPDRTWSPQAYEIKYRHQDLKFAQTKEQAAAHKFTLKNFNRFKNANYYELKWTVLEDGKELFSGIFTNEAASLAPPTGSIAGASEKELTVPYQIENPKAGAEYILQIDYCLKEDHLYAKKGYVQGSEQFAIDVEVEDKVVELHTMAALTTDNGETEVTVSGTTADEKPFTVIFNKETGLMTAYQVGGKDLISKAPVGSFFRPETDQNAAINGTNWTKAGEAYDNWFDQGENMKDVSVRVTSVIPQVTQFLVNAKLQNGSDFATTYTVYGNATVVVTAKLTPSDTAPSQLGEFGMWMQIPKEYENMSWYGRGPSETYWNRKAGNMTGVWNGTVTEQFVPYLRSQENGNKTDVRWLALRNEEGEGILAGMTYGEGYTGDMLEAVALHYTAGEISTHRSGNWYPFQAEATEDVNLRLLLHQKGVGNVNWSGEPVSAVINKNRSELLEYSYTLMPLSKDADPMEKSKEILGQMPEIPTITSIGFDDKVISGFDPETLEYTVELPSGYEGIPTVSAKGPSILDISCKQAEQIPGTAVVTVVYQSEETGLSSQVEYQVHFDPGSSSLERMLSSLVTIPSMTAEHPVIRPGGRLLYGYSGYGSIFQNYSNGTGVLTLGPGNAQTTYQTGFAGNTTQILDIDISGLNPVSFSGAAGIDWLLKPNQSKSSIIFEVWAHKDVSVLTEEYYRNPEHIDPEIDNNGSADWTASGWVKLAASPLITGNAADPKYIFTELPMTYAQGETTKAYEAIRLVMNANGDKGHDQGVWGNPRIMTIADEWPGSGFEEPKEDSVRIQVNGVDLEGFDPGTKEYNVTLNYGAALPQVTAQVYENGGSVPVKVSQISGLPGDVTVSYDNGAPTAYTIHFTKDSAIEGASAYLPDLVELAGVEGPASYRNGNLLYAYTGAGAIYKDRSEGSGNVTKLQLKKDDSAIQMYGHGFAGRAQQVLDFDISSQKAGIFRADVGIDYVMKPGAGIQSAEGPTVRFEVWAHKNVAQISYGNTKMTPDGTDQDGFEQQGWVKLAESPVMSNGDYNGTLETQENLHRFNVDLTYLDGKETKSYEALRLVMNPVDGSVTDDQGIWGDARVDFIQEETALMELPILDNTKIVADENGVSVPVLLNSIDTSADRIFDIMLVAYDEEGRLAGYTTERYNAKDTGSNIDSTIAVNYDTAAAGDSRQVFMIWYGDETAAPVFGAFTRTGNGGFVYDKLSYVNGIAENPKASVSIDAAKDEVTVTGTGFEPNSALSFTALYEQGRAGRAASYELPDYIGQLKADASGKFRYTYVSNYDVDEKSNIDVAIGGQGLAATVKATTRTASSPDRAPVVNKPGTAVYNDKMIDVSQIEGLFDLDPNAGSPRYSVVRGGTGEAVMEKDGKTLNVSVPGTIRIGAVTAPTDTHASGAQVIAVLTVNNNSDRSVLAELISLAQSKEGTDYTAESYAALQDAIEAAELTAADANALQNALDEGALSVLQAICGLQAAGSTHPMTAGELHAAITLAELKQEINFTAASWENLQAALTLAKETAALETIPQQTLETAITELLAALGGMEIQQERTYLQDFNAQAALPEGWRGLPYNNMAQFLAVEAASGAPAGYPESVTGNAVHATGSGGGARGARIAYSEYGTPVQATYDFDVYLNPSPTSGPNVFYLEQGNPETPPNAGTSGYPLTSTFFALANGMTAANTLEYYDYDAKNWVAVSNGNGKWLHVTVKADFAQGKVSFTIKNGDTVLAEVPGEAALSFADTVTAFNRITMAAPRNGGTVNCNIWLDNFAVTGVFTSGKIQVTQVGVKEEGVQVPSGTALKDLKAELAKLTFTAQVESGIVPAPVNEASLWTVEGYDGTAGTYQATAKVALPAGFEWAAGASDTVAVTVTVADIPAEVDKEALNTLITRAEAKEEADYTEESFAALKTALDAAKETAAKEDASQEEVDTAKAALQEALDNLAAKNPETALKDILEKAEAAQKAAEDAEKEAKDAAKASEDAKKDAVTAQSDAQAAASDAADAKQKAGEAQKKAEDAQQKAETARNEALAAQAAAADAQQKADAAKLAAEDAQKLAQTNQEEAEAAQRAAEDAQDAAELAYQNAKTAAENAEAAETNAKTAAENANTAAENAKTAELNALTAQEAAEDAMRNAQACETNASVSASAAQTAQAAATAAKDAAKGYKDDAQAAAAAAAEALEQAQSAKQQAAAAKDEAVSAKEAVTKARDDAQEAKREALDAKNDAALSAIKASNASDMAQNAYTMADAARKLAETYQNGAQAAQDLAKAYRDGAVEAQRLAREAQAKAEQAAREAEEALKQVQKEAEEKLAAADQKLTSADRNLKKTETLVAKQRFKNRKAVILSKKSTKKRQVKLNWKYIKEAEGYVIQCSTNAKFDSIKTVEVKGGDSQAKTIKGLKSGKKYYFRMRAYRTINGKRVYSKYSAKKSLKVR